MIILIILAVVATFGFAYLIVKYLPLKFKWIISLVLVFLGALLVFKIYDGIMKPINFTSVSKTYGATAWKSRIATKFDTDAIKLIILT